MKVPVPREHGTWAMLYAPLICAIVSVGYVDLRLGLFLLSTTAAFFLREPLETWIRLRTLKSSDESRLAELRNWIAAYLVPACVPAAYLMISFDLWLLPIFAAIYCAMLVLHVLWISNRSDRQVQAELAAVLALTSSAPACRYAMLGTLDFTAFLLWALNALFFASSVFYVKMRVSRVARKHSTSHAVTLSCLYHLLLAAALATLAMRGWIPWLATLAFAPVLVRAFWGILSRGKLSLTRIGIGEVVFTVVFVCIMILSFR